MTLLDLSRTLFGSVEFGPDFLTCLVVLVIIIQIFSVAVDLIKGRTF